jgi:hypothetical protein
MLYMYAYIYVAYICIRICLYMYIYTDDFLVTIVCISDLIIFSKFLYVRVWGVWALRVLRSRGTRPRVRPTLAPSSKRCHVR